jgi:ATP-binding protein involved in chromosome partitioning
VSGEASSTDPDRVPVVAVASGKGGVGKTTVAVNLALALVAAGQRVGLVDADLYGPDVPRMLGLRRRADARELILFSARGKPQAQLQAIERHGLQVASAAFLIGDNQGLGLEANLAQLLVRRLIVDTQWQRPDCLVVDLPPGTADVQQFVFALHRRPVYVLVVVTPQVIAHSDVRRLLADLRRRKAVTLGGVENFSGLICAHCGQVTPMFPAAPADESIWGLVDRLASVPFSPAAAADADQGLPVMVSRAVPAQVTAFELLATEVTARMRDHSAPTADD